MVDHCSTILQNAYFSAVGHSDHCLVQLLPIYRQQLKSAKPVVRTIKRWSNEAKLKLILYISFCEDMCTRQDLFNNYDKP